jgi:hypothetical protein
VSFAPKPMKDLWSSIRQTGGRRVLRRLVLFCFVMGAITVLCYPFQWNRKDAEVAVTALGTHNPESKGTEVWIAAFAGTDASRLVREGKYGTGWEARGERMVSYTAQPAALRWRGPVDKGFSMTLARHPFSGQVRVSVGGVTRNFDLYAKDAQFLRLTLADFPGALLQRPTYLPMQYIGLSIAFGALYFLAALTALWLPRRVPRSPRIGNPGMLWTLAFAVPSLLVYATAHLGFWPAQMSLDSIDLWQRVEVGPINDAGSALHSAIVLLSSRIYDSPASIIVVNSLLLSFATTLWLRELWRWGLPSPLLCVIAIAFPLFPANFFLVTVVWKDLLYAAGFLLAFTALLNILRAARERVGAWAVAQFGIALLLIALTRHNGIIVVPGLVLLVLLATWSTPNLKSLAGVSAVVLVTVAATKLLLYPALGIEGLPERFRGIVPMHIIAAYAREAPDMTARDEPVLTQILPMRDWRERYDCQNVSPLFFNESTNYAALTQHSRDLLRISARYILADPLIYLRHQACATSMLWKIDAGGDFLYTTPAQIEDSAVTRMLGLEMRPRSQHIFELLQAVKAYTEREDMRAFFWGTAPALFLSVFVAIVFAIRWRNWRYVLLCALPALNAVSLAPLIGSPDYRYGYPSVVVMLALLPLFLGASRLGLSDGSPARVKSSQPRMACTPCS